MRRRKDEAEPVVATETVDEAQEPEEQESGEQTGDPTADEKPDTQAVPDAEATDDAVAEGTAAAGPEPVLVPHRPAGKRLKIAAAAAAVLFVAGGAFIGAMAQPVIANRAMVADETGHRPHRRECDHHAVVVHPGQHGLACRPLGPLPDRRFRLQYRKFIDSIVATNKQAQVTNTTSVLGTAVESVNPSEASAVVYTNSVATSPVSKNIPSLRYLSYRLEMKRDRRRLAHHPDDDDHHAGSHPAAVGQAPVPVTSPVSARLTVTGLLLLTFATGLVDAISVLVLGHVFVANMTGNVIFLGFWFVPTLRCRHDGRRRRVRELPGRRRCSAAASPATSSTTPVAG